VFTSYAGWFPATVISILIAPPERRRTASAYSGANRLSPVRSVSTSGFAVEWLEPPALFAAEPVHPAAASATVKTAAAARVRTRAIPRRRRRRDIRAYRDQTGSLSPNLLFVSLLTPLPSAFIT